VSATLPATTSKAPRANWNDAEITALIDYLIKHIADVGDGGNFKKATFTGALRGVGPHHSVGLSIDVQVEISIGELSILIEVDRYVITVCTDHMVLCKILVVSSSVVTPVFLVCLQCSTYHLAQVFTLSSPFRLCHKHITDGSH
jgi:hypothetical protein